MPLASTAQIDSLEIVTEIQNFQTELNNEYINPSTSPLKQVDLTAFKHHNFYPIDLNFVVEAQLTLTPHSPFKPMKTTGTLVQEYRTYAIARFQLLGQYYSLPLYQSKSLMHIPQYKDYLFLPFTDLTSGEESYGGGRYLGLRIPSEGHLLIINFNLAYNPYCAYNEKYSCPIVPDENHLPVAVRAGVMTPEK